MSRKYIFTKRFYALSPADQAAVVDAAIRDLELVIGDRPVDQRAIRRSITRVKKKAIECGVYGEEVDHG